MSNINYNDAEPAAPTGTTNCKWQADTPVSDLVPRNVSVYMPLFVGDTGGSPVETPESGAVPAPSSGDAAAGKYLKADGTWEVPPVPVAALTSVRESPAGTMNGTNAIFTLSFDPSEDSLILSLNGVIQSPGSGSPITGADFTISGLTITYTVPPKASDFHVAWYTH